MGKPPKPPGDVMTSITIHFEVQAGAVASTSIAYTPVAGWTQAGGIYTSTEDIAAGETLGTAVVEPGNWAGAMTLAVTPAGSISMVGEGRTFTLSATADWPTGSNYSATLTATP